MKVIQAQGIGKQYRIGAVQRGRYQTLRESLVDAGKRPFRWARRRVQGEQTAVRDTHFWALQDVSFAVEQGEVVGLIGRNGAGKSTLLKILSRITEPSTGHIDLYGRVGSLLEVGTGFHQELTGRENIYLNGAILGMRRSEISQKFDEIVDFAEVETFIDTPVKHYSSGMYLRLAFAVAAHLEPEILLVDEVLAVGDAAFQRKCLGKMGDVAQAGRTVVFVSHNMAAVRKLCTRALLLEGGRKQLEGPTDEVVDHYLALDAVDKTAVVPLPAFPNTSAAAVHLRFTTASGTPQTHFRLGEPWCILLEFELFRPLPQVIAAVGLINFESVGLITYWSRPRDLQPGRYCVEFTCDVPLKSCHLQFAVGLSSNEKNVYHVQNVGHVVISEAAVGEQPFRASGSGLLLSQQTSDIVPIPAWQEETHAQ